MASAFDKIAKKEPEKKSKSSVKTAADVTAEIKTAVDLYVAHKAEVKRLEAEQTEAYDKIVAHVRPQYDKFARKGSFAKSMTVDGNAGSVTATWANSFSIPQDDASMSAIKKVVGAKFEEWFPSKRTIKVKEDAQKNDALMNKLVAAAKSAGMSLDEVFDVTDARVAGEDLDRKQFELDDGELATFRTLVRQKAASLK